MPLTYRAAPLAGACGDPVYVAELARTILTGDTQVRLEILTPDGTIERENVVHVKGSGAGTASSSISDITLARTGTDSVISSGDLTVTVHHVLTAGAAPSSPHLTDTWPGVTEAQVMATLTQPS